VATQWTGDDGSYLFADVAPGDYYLQFTAPDRYGFSPADQGLSDALDSDADPATGQTGMFNLSMGQRLDDEDAGLKQVGGSVGDRVWFDWNHDGLQGDDEAGIPDLAVRLYTASGALFAETTTDENGDYWFPTVAPGAYYLQFDHPSWSAFTVPHAGDTTVDSDVTDSTTGRTDDFDIALGDVKDDLDAGINYPLIGDWVWNDSNGNGLQDPGEPGVAGVTVRLLDDTGAVVDETATDASGHYEFSWMDPGSYRIQVVAPDGQVFTQQNQGTDETLDSDVDSSGLSDLFTVAAGDVRSDIDAGLIAAAPNPTLSVSDASLIEGNTGSNMMSFTVTLSAASSTTIAVDYATADGTATAGTDYQPTSGTLTFNPGETSKTVTVAIMGDTTPEPDETLFLNLSNPVNAGIADGQGQGTILNDDNSQPRVSIGTYSGYVAEGNSGTTTFYFVIMLSAPSSQVVTVDYATADGTATAGSDYQSTSGTLTFNPGETMKMVAVTIYGDTVVEPNEFFAMNLSNAVNANINIGQATGYIFNDD
jgi:hypothetical protein